MTTDPTNRGPADRAGADSTLPALLLIHGFPLDRSMWQPQIEDLADAARVIAPNLPGFGGVPAAASTTTMDAMADACVAALDAAGVRRAIVCGLSMGGYVALAMWREHRERIAGLVLANTRARPDDEAGRQRRAALAERARQEGLASLVDQPPPLFSTHVSAELLQWARQVIGAQAPEGVAAASLGMADRPDATVLLPNIGVPALVITSAEDTLIPPDATREMAEDIPNTDFEIIEGAGHLSNFEAPGEFNALLRRFIERVGPIA